MNECKTEPKIMERRWSPELEEELIKIWEKDGLFRFDPSSPGEIYTIDTPPPYITAKWHVGSAAHYASIDMVARYKRLLGYNVHFPIGWDRNGLPVEVIVERQFNIRVKDVDREYFINLCKQVLDSVEAEVINQARRLGLSCDFENMYRTDSPEYRSLTQETFIELWRRGLIYESKRPTNWCPRCGTAIADAEVEYVETMSKLFYILFKVKETGKNVPIATTRPELLAGCDAVIFNPADERYIGLEGRTLVVPIYGKEVKAMANSYAKPDFGTGLVMVCSYGDTSDIRLFRELGLKPTRVIDENATLTEEAGFLKGLKVEEARRRIVEELSNGNLLVKAEEILQRVPVCWRCGTRLEFVEMSELYLKQEEFVNRVREVSSRMVFHHESMRQILMDWINSIRGDWPISRRRYYATEVPLWYCRKCGEPYVPKPGKYYRPWKDSPGDDAKCKCGGTEFRGDDRVLDTWMDSSISQLFVTGYRRNDCLFKRSWVCSLRPQGYEIIRTWLYYSILRTVQLLNTPPFKEVRISGLGLDEKGEAMHKSKGNVIFPDEYLKKYGADAFRFWAASEAKLGSNYRFSEERLKGARLFLTKLWNIGRFISSFEYLDRKPGKLCFLDRLALSELKRVLEEAKRDYESLDFYGPSNLLRNYVWNFFADHYLEAVKPRAYLRDGREEAESAWYTLHRVLRACLISLSPIIPFITDYLFRSIYGETVVSQSFPSLDDVEPVDGKVSTLFMNVNSAIWKFKKKLGVSLNEKICYTVYVPDELKPLEQDLIRMHRVEVSYGSPGAGSEKVEDVFFKKL